MENIFNWSDNSRAEGGLIFRKARRGDRIPSLEFTFCISSLPQREAGPRSRGAPEIGWVLMEMAIDPRTWNSLTDLSSTNYLSPRGCLSP